MGQSNVSDDQMCLWLFFTLLCFKNCSLSHYSTLMKILPKTLLELQYEVLMVCTDKFVRCVIVYRGLTVERRKLKVFWTKHRSTPLVLHRQNNNKHTQSPLFTTLQYKVAKEVHAERYTHTKGEERVYMWREEVALTLFVQCLCWPMTSFACSVKNKIISSRLIYHLALIC